LRSVPFIPLWSPDDKHISGVQRSDSLVTSGLGLISTLAMHPSLRAFYIANHRGSKLCSVRAYTHSIVWQWCVGCMVNVFECSLDVPNSLTTRPRAFPYIELGLSAQCSRYNYSDSQENRFFGVLELHHRSCSEPSEVSCGAFSIPVAKLFRFCCPWSLPTALYCQTLTIPCA